MYCNTARYELTTHHTFFCFLINIDLRHYWIKVGLIPQEKKFICIYYYMYIYLICLWINYDFKRRYTHMCCFYPNTYYQRSTSFVQRNQLALILENIYQLSNLKTRLSSVTIRSFFHDILIFKRVNYFFF